METMNKQSELIEKYQTEYERTLELRNRNIATRTVPKPTITPIDLSEYIADCEVISKEELPEFSATDIAEELSRASMDAYPQGKKFCLAIIPFLAPELQKDNLIKTDIGKQEWQNFIESQGFMKALTVYPEYENLTDGMNETSGFYFDILPKELQKDISQGGTTFKLDYPENTDHRAWFAQQYIKAYENLKKLLKK